MKLQILHFRKYDLRTEFFKGHIRSTFYLEVHFLFVKFLFKCYIIKKKYEDTNFHKMEYDLKGHVRPFSGHGDFS